MVCENEIGSDFKMPGFLKSCLKNRKAEPEPECRPRIKPVFRFRPGPSSESELSEPIPESEESG